MTDWIGIASIVVNLVLTVFSGVLGFMIRGMKDQFSKFEQSIALLQNADAAMASKVASVETLVAGKYASRDEMMTLFKDLTDVRTNVARLESRIQQRRAED